MLPSNDEEFKSLRQPLPSHLDNAYKQELNSKGKPEVASVLEWEDAPQERPKRTRALANPTYHDHSKLRQAPPPHLSNPWKQCLSARGGPEISAVLGWDGGVKPSDPKPKAEFVQPTNFMNRNKLKLQVAQRLMKEKPVDNAPRMATTFNTGIVSAKEKSRQDNIKATRRVMSEAASKHTLATAARSAQRASKPRPQSAHVPGMTIKAGTPQNPWKKRDENLTRGGHGPPFAVDKSDPFEGVNYTPRNPRITYQPPSEHGTPRSVSSCASSARQPPSSKKRVSEAQKQYQWPVVYRNTDPNAPDPLAPEDIGDAPPLHANYDSENRSRYPWPKVEPPEYVLNSMQRCKTGTVKSPGKDMKNATAHWKSENQRRFQGQPVSREMFTDDDEAEASLKFGRSAPRAVEEDCGDPLTYRPHIRKPHESQVHLTHPSKGGNTSTEYNQAFPKYSPTMYAVKRMHGPTKKTDPLF